MIAYFKGEPILGPGGGGSGGGNPIGTIISFMGLAAPTGYLVCDGAEYRLSEYPALADLFRRQFGRANYFGGDGTTTFAVPDMRNLFLRGHHGEAEEQLSGNLGEKQEGTCIPNLYGGPNGIASIGSGDREAVYMDNGLDRTKAYQFQPFSGNGWQALQSGALNASQYTTRPVNMAVLFCVKATEADSGSGSPDGGADLTAGEVYSTEETRIGTWIDGKPLYQVTLVTQHPSISNRTWVNSGSIQNMDYGMIDSGEIKETHDPTLYDLKSSLFRLAIGEGGLVQFYPENFSAARATSWITVKYTKTTD